MPDEPDPLYQQLNDAIVRSSASSTPGSPRRRRVPRQDMSWLGGYRLNDSGQWADCEVVDISVAGVSALIATASADNLPGASITMEVHAAVGDAVRLELTGEIRHAVPAADGRVRVGVEFTGLSDTERAILDALERMGMGW